MIPLHQSLAKDYGKQQQHMAYDAYGDRTNWTRLSYKIFYLRTILLKSRALPLADRYIGNDLEMSGVH